MSDRCRQEAQGATSWKVNFYTDENSRKKALYQRGNPKANLQYYDDPQEHFALIKNKLRDNDSARNVFPDLKVVDVNVNEREITFEISGENYEALQPLPREGTLSSEQFNAIERTCNQAAEHAGNVKWLLRYWEADSLFLYKKDFKWHALYARYHHAAPWSEDWENDEFKNWHRPELGRKPNYCNGKGKNWGYATRSHDLTAKNLLLAELRKRATISPSQADRVIPTPSQDNSEAAISQEPPHPARLPPAQDPEKPESLAATSEAHGAASSASARRNETRQIFPNSTKGKYKLAVIALAITLVAGALFRYLQPEPGPSVRITAPQTIQWPSSNPKLRELAFSYVTKNVSWSNLKFKLQLPNRILNDPKSNNGSNVVFDVSSESITADAAIPITLVVKDQHGKQLNAHEVTVNPQAPKNPPPPPPIVPITVVENKRTKINFSKTNQVHTPGLKDKYTFEVDVTDVDVLTEAIENLSVERSATNAGLKLLSSTAILNGRRYTYEMEFAEPTVRNENIVAKLGNVTKTNFFSWRSPGVSVTAQDVTWNAGEMPPKLVFNCAPCNVNWSDLKFQIGGNSITHNPNLTNSQFKFEFQLATNSVSAGANETFKLTITLNNTKIAEHTVKVKRTTAPPRPSISRPQLGFDPTKPTNVYARITQEIPIKISQIATQELANPGVTLGDHPLWLGLTRSGDAWSLVASNPPSPGRFPCTIKIVSTRLYETWTYTNTVWVKPNEPTEFRFTHVTNTPSQNASSAGNHQTWEIALNDPDVFDCAATNLTVRRGNTNLLTPQIVDGTTNKFRVQIPAPNPLSKEELLIVELGTVTNSLRLSWAELLQKEECKALVKSFRHSIDPLGIDARGQRRQCLNKLLVHLESRGATFVNYANALTLFRQNNGSNLDAMALKDLRNTTVAKWFSNGHREAPPGLKDMSLDKLLDAILETNGQPSE